MPANWPVMTNELRPYLKDLRGGAPEVMKAFSAIAQAALAPKALGTSEQPLERGTLRSLIRGAVDGGPAEL